MLPEGVVAGAGSLLLQAKAPSEAAISSAEVGAR
jgi:hypothetical protein